MDNVVMEHPTTDELVEFALEEGGGHLDDHVVECPACARVVREVRMARDDIRALPDESVPSYLERAILSHADTRTRNTRPQFWGRFGEWYRHPLLIGLSVILMSIFFYILFVFVL